MATSSPSKSRLLRTLRPIPSNRFASTSAGAFAAIALVIAGCGTGTGARPAVSGSPVVVAPGLQTGAGSGSQTLTFAAVTVLPRRQLRAGGVIGFPVASPRAWVVSLDVQVTAGSRLAVGLGERGPTLVLTRRPGGQPALTAAGSTSSLPDQSGWGRAGWRHIEATPTSVAIDGRRFAVSSGTGAAITLRLTRGRAQIAALIASSAADRGALLLHRLTELHARVPARQFPEGADLVDRIRYGSRYWTSGFYAGALWQAAALTRAGARLFSQWALAATIDHFGQERSPTHDVGFMYGESSLAGWRALCRGATSPSELCTRLKDSVLSAADELRVLAASNRRAGTIPTNATSHQANTIIDGMMNIAILPWATRITGNPAYAQLAAQHAHRVAELLVRADGSTTQSVNFDRATGRVLFRSTHQGLSSASTWSRGQGWAVYGFAQAAADLHDRGLLRVAERAAAYVAAHLPSGGVPRWDYDAPPGAPVDVSAGVITAAGLLHLEAACQQMPGACTDSGRWVPLARRMLAGALEYTADRPPVGFLGSQVLNERGRGCWCDGGELIFGLTYALEGLRLLERQPAA